MTTLFERHPVKTICFTLAALFAFLLALDITAANVYRHLFGITFHDRARSPEKQEQLRREAIEKSYRIRSDVFHHGFKKNVHVSQSKWGDAVYEMNTDSLGFKSEKKAETKLSSDNHRIVFIGDSFTEGIGIPFADTFVGRIAHALENKNIDVLNAAVASYSPIIYFRRIQYLIDMGLAFDHLVVFIDISDIHDEAVVYEMSPDNRVITRKSQETTIVKVKRLIEANTIAVHRIVTAVGRLFSAAADSQADRRGINVERALWTIDEKRFQEYGRQGLALADTYMTRLGDLLKDRGIRLTIAVYPWPDQILHNDMSSIQVTHWKQWARENGADFINYFECFKNRSSIETWFIPGDVHWNPKGHRLIADEFLAFYANKECTCAEPVWARPEPED